jgi:hypothetical protein
VPVKFSKPNLLDTGISWNWHKLRFLVDIYHNSCDVHGGSNRLAMNILHNFVLNILWRCKSALCAASEISWCSLPGTTIKEKFFVYTESMISKPLVQWCLNCLDQAPLGVKMLT